MTNSSGNRSFDSPFGVRLRAARKMAGFSMEDLAKRLGGMVTKQAIGKYEKGLMMPTPSVLERLIEVLKSATWGASPLGNTEIRACEPMLLRETDVAGNQEILAGMRFRRQRLLGRMKNAERLGDDAIQPLECHKVVSLESPVLRGSIQKPASTSKALHDLITNDFASLSERRARYVRAWEDVSGPEKIRFRAGEKLPAKSASALKYRLADYFERYRGLESLLGVTEPFVNPVGGSPVGTTDEVEAVAESVRHCWDLGAGPVVNLLGCLEDKGIRIFETSGIEGFEGLSGAFGTVPFVAVSRDFPVDRVRFTAAHELAHVLCGFPEKDGAEGLCHAFAGAFLLPKAAVEKAFGRPRSKVTLGELAEIKTTFGISLQAIMHRARTLGLVTDRQFRSFRETVKAKGWSVTEPIEYAGLERATRFRRLVHHAVAADILNLERAAELAGVPADELKNEIGEIF